MLERPALARLDGDGEFMTIDLFDNEKDGFTSVRIPAVVATEAGLVLAFAVGRTQVSDWSESKILLRRSVDEGMTWTPAQVVAGACRARRRQPRAHLRSAAWPDPPALPNRL